MTQPSGNTDELAVIQKLHHKDEELSSPNVSHSDAEQFNAEASEATTSFGTGDLVPKAAKDGEGQTPSLCAPSLLDSNRSWNNRTGDLWHEPLKDVEGIASFCNEIRAQQQWQMQLTQYDQENARKMWAQLEALQNLCHDTAAMGMQHAKTVLGLGVRMDVLEKQVSHLLDEPSEGNRTGGTLTKSEPNSGEDHDALQQYAETALKVSAHVSSIEKRMDQIESRIGIEVQRALREFAVKPNLQQAHSFEKDGIPCVLPLNLSDNLGKGAGSAKQRMPTLSAEAAEVRAAISGASVVSKWGAASGTSFSSTRRGGSLVLGNNHPQQSLDSFSSSAGLLIDSLHCKMQQKVASRRLGYSPQSPIRRLQSQPVRTSSEGRSPPMRMKSVSIYQPKDNQITGEANGTTSHVDQNARSVEGTLKERAAPKASGSSLSLLSSNGALDSPLQPARRLSLGNFLENQQSLGVSYRRASSCDSVEREAHTPSTSAFMQSIPPQVVGQSYPARTASPGGSPSGYMPAQSYQTTPSQITRMVSPTRMQSLSMPIHKAQALTQERQEQIEISIATLESLTARSGIEATSASYAASVSGSAMPESAIAMSETPPQGSGRNLQASWESSGRNLQASWAAGALPRSVSPGHTSLVVAPPRLASHPSATLLSTPKTSPMIAPTLVGRSPNGRSSRVIETTAARRHSPMPRYSKPH